MFPHYTKQYFYIIHLHFYHHHQNKYFIERTEGANPYQHDEQNMIFSTASNWSLLLAVSKLSMQPSSEVEQAGLL